MQPTFHFLCLIILYTMTSQELFTDITTRIDFSVYLILDTMAPLKSQLFKLQNQKILPF